MKCVEIETGVRCGSDKWGYVIHYYRDFETFEYQGCSGPCGTYASQDEAYCAAVKMLDREYGRGGWSQ